MTKKDNNDTLITFGEEALTMRKDDPRTQEYKEKMLKQMDENKKMYEDAKKNPFKELILAMHVAKMKRMMNIKNVSN